MIERTMLKGNCVIKGTILLRNYRKVTLNGHFPTIPLQNFMVKIGATA